MDVRYKIITPLAGEGGFGKVDKATDTFLERNVAIKTLDPLFKDILPADIERFKREAKTLARLSHPNIPAIYDLSINASEIDFKIFYEWIEGLTLTKYLQDRGTISIDKAKIWFGNICSALQHAHDSGIIHRDIKPSNIVITQNEDACYIVDFGIALRAEDIQKITGDSKLGTHGYMSPEHERREELDHTTDIWSLGIILYESLCGTRPTIGQYRPLNTINEAIPPAVDDLIKNCLLEKNFRIKSASEFYTYLINATRPHSNLANILSQGPMHEMIAALTEMDENSFLELPAGQRILILTRAKTLVKHDDFKLRNPAASFLAELIRLGPRLEEQDCNFISQNAFKYGFNLNYGGSWVGNPKIRAELTKVALTCNPNMHKAISTNLISFHTEHGLTDKDGWYIHDLRVIIQNLLSNTVCDHSLGSKLAVILEQTIDETLGQ